jgi:integrase
VVPDHIAERAEAAMVSLREKVRADGGVSYIARFRIKGERDRWVQTSESFDTARARARFVRDVDKLGIERAREILDADREEQRKVEAPTLREVAEDYIATRTGVQQATLKRYEAMVRNDLAPLVDMDVDRIDADDVARWVQAMEKAGVSGKTISNKHGFLSGVMKRAVRLKHATSNPCEGTRLPDDEDHEKVFLTESQFAHLLAYFPPYYQPLVASLVGLGLRFSEATALEVRDVDLDVGVVTVRQAWKKARVGFEVGVPKSKAGRRTIGLSASLARALSPLCVGRPGDAWLFTAVEGGPVRYAQFLASVWKPALRAANGLPVLTGDPKADRRVASMMRGMRPATTPLGVWPSPHSLRHTAASWWIRGRIDILTVSRQLGHESTQTTTKIYGHLMPGAVLETAAVMDRALSLALPQVEEPLLLEG